MKTNVKIYTSKQLLDWVKRLQSFKYIPVGYWSIMVRSTEDSVNEFDDKFYLFKGEEFVSVTSCTTNKGLNGTAVIQSNNWNYDSHRFGLHKGKMEALRQVKGINYYRDTNKDLKTDETGKIFNDIIFVNIHGATYNKGSKQVSTKIGGWSEGCIVLNDNAYYENFISLVKNQSSFSFVIIREF